MARIDSPKVSQRHSQSIMPVTSIISLSLLLASQLLILALLPLASAFGSYTEANLHRLAQASSLSYLSLDKIPSSPYYQTCQLEPIVQVVDPASESGATIFIDKSNSSTTQKVIVACRGSANPKNFGTNLKFNLVPATRLATTTTSTAATQLPNNALVHEGFQDASVGLWNVLGPRLINILEKDAEIVFTGHSLGAATALLCSVHYRQASPSLFFGSNNNNKYNNNNNNNEHATPPPPSPTIVTFGGPKLCNGILARHLRTYVLDGCNILHLVHDKDPVLANNQKLWDSLGFENVGVELECDPNRPVVFGGKDSKESFLFGNFAWNIMDHCNYMGVFVGPRVLG